MRTRPAPFERPEARMNRFWMALAATTALACAGQAAMAQGKDDEEALEKRLEDAQQRLEAAAREIAELTAKTGGPQAGMFNIAVAGPRRAMLGINLGGSVADAGGVRVEGVSPGGPAAEAGVRAGDVIVGIDGKNVATNRDLLTVVKALDPGQRVALDLRRDGKAVKATVTARASDHLFYGPGLAMTRTAPAIAAVEAVPGIPAIPAIPPMPALGAHW